MGTRSPFQRAFQVHQHHVIAARLELDGLAWGKFQPRHGAHPHHVAFHLHLVDLGAARGRALRAEEACRAPRS